MQLTCCRLHMSQVRLLRRLSSKRGWPQQAQPGASSDKSKVWTAQWSSQPRCSMLALPALTIRSCKCACCCKAVCKMERTLLALQPFWHHSPGQSFTALYMHQGFERPVNAVKLLHTVVIPVELPEAAASKACTTRLCTAAASAVCSSCTSTCTGNG